MATTSSPSPAPSCRRTLILRLLLAALSTSFLLLTFHYYGNTSFVERFTHSLFLWFYGMWTDDNPGVVENSHGPLVVLVSLFVLYRRWPRLRIATRQACWPCALLIPCGLLAHWVGIRAQQATFSALGFVLLLWAIPSFLLGRVTARQLLFPCGFLFFAVPLNFLEKLSFPLRMVATQLAHGLMTGMGFPILRHGSSLLCQTPGHEFALDVADPCSGLHSIVALAALTAGYAYFSQDRRGKKVFLFLLTLPIAVIGNVVRIMSIALVAYFGGQDRALQLYHDFSGYIVFIVAVLIIMALASLMDRLVPRRSAPWPPSAATTRPAGTGRSLWPDLSLALCLGAVVLIVPAGMHIRFVDVPGLRVALPDSVGPWTGQDIYFCQNNTCLQSFSDPHITDHSPCPACGEALSLIALPERLLLPADTRIVRKRYRHFSDTIDVTMVFSGVSRSSIHKPEWCLTGQGYLLNDTGATDIPLDGRAPLPVRVLETTRSLITEDGRTLRALGYYAYCFVGRYVETPFQLTRMLHMASERVLSGRAYPWAYITVAGVRSPDSDSYRRELIPFMQDLYPLIRINPDDAPTPSR